MIPGTRAETGLKPHLVTKFKISNDQREEKVTDVVDLSMSPSDRALVLCVDEKRDPGARA